MIQVVSYNCECGYSAFEDEYVDSWDGTCINCGEKQRQYRILYRKESKPKNKSNFCNIDSQQKDNLRWSWSMGIDIRDIPKMKKLYPDREYHPKTGQLLVKNRQHKKRLMKEHGLHEH